MTKMTKFQTTFEFGEVSPRLLARIDLPAYGKAVRTQINAYSLVHGGATKRRGTLMTGPLKNEAERGRLIPFTFSITTKFMLLLNGGRMQFIKDGALVKDGGGSTYELVVPYTAAELPAVQYAQSGNTMYLVHPAHAPKILQRVTDSNWTLADIPFIYNAVSDVTFSNAFITFKIINGSEVFASGEYFTITTSGGAITGIAGPTGGVGNGQIAGVASMPGASTSETWTITCTFSASNRQEWSVVGSVSGATPSYWKSGNYPQTVSFFEQRLFFGGSPQFPQHIWGSCAGDYLNMTVGNRDSDGVAVQIAGNDYNGITHLVSARNLMPLTTSTEFSLAGPSSYAISGISSNVIKDHTRNGSNHVKPLRIGREVIFVQRDGKKARAISYSVTEDANVAPDITLFAEHLTRDATFVDMAFASDPDYIGWVVRSDGTLCSLTLAREFETTAWARHSTEGDFESVGVIPGAAADDVYVIVRRVINGQVRRFVERFDYSDIVDCVYHDCSTVYSGPASKIITGLGYLEGMTVTATADGVVHPSRVVTGGSIELEFPASYVTVGLSYTATLELLDPEFGDPSQPSSGKPTSVTDIVVRFQETVNAKINGVEIPFRKVGDLLDTSVSPFTGDKRVKNLGWRSPANITISSDTPTPFTVLGVIIEAAVSYRNDR